MTMLSLRFTRPIFMRILLNITAAIYLIVSIGSRLSLCGREGLFQLFYFAILLLLFFAIIRNVVVVVALRKRNAAVGTKHPGVKQFRNQPLSRNIIYLSVKTNISWSSEG